MGPGAAVDAFLAEAPHTQVVIGPDGEVEPGRYDRVAVTVRDRGELRALRVPSGVRTTALAVWLDEGSSALSLTPRPEWPTLQLIRSRAVDGGWLVVLRFAAPLPVHRVVAELGRQSVWPDHAGQRGVVLGHEATEKVAADRVEVFGPDPLLELGPLDERVLNPTGFTRHSSEPVLDLSELDWGRGPTEALVRRLRAARGVRADLPQANALLAARVMAGLAMAGVPLVAESLRPQVAATAGVRVARQPSVSIVMATRRPDLLDHALEQVRRQRGVERLQLVLAPHGFTPQLDDADVLVVPQGEDVRFGDVLHAAATAADGDVVMKMDDDDWYAPDAVADLLLARAWSGAELVGMPDDVYYVEPTDETLRLGQPTEVYRQFVAGGTLMLDRGLLHEVGGFRSVRRHVDAELIAAVRAAGGATYRTHGLGYVLRRTDTGHTWQADLDDLRSRAAGRQPGFAPGRLMIL